MERIKYNINDLLNDISDTNNGIGEDLTYTSIYDDIKKARFEEDNTLSQGVWEHELQAPNWEIVEQLSVDAIRNKSKDLQIIGWLIEALVVLDKFEGIAHGINILNEFVKKYLNVCYPLLDNNNSDNDQKLRILEWIYETIYRRSNLVPIFGEGSFSIYNYEYALEINSNIIKNPNNKDQILESAHRNGIKCIDEINTIINSTEQDKIIKLNTIIDNIKDNINKYKNTLIEKTGNDRSFNKLINNINTIEKILLKRNISDNKINNDNSQNTSDVSNNTECNNCTNINKSLNREEIYKLLSNLYLLLKEIDKHSPSPYLLSLILEWKDKTLLEIINDVKTGNTESHQLLRMLLS